MKDWFDENGKAAQGDAVFKTKSESTEQTAVSRWSIGFPNLNLSSLSSLTSVGD